MSNAVTPPESRPAAAGRVRTRGAPSNPASDGLGADDVIQAYRWLLGREPESMAVIESKVVHAKRKSVLRRRMMRSQEFKQKFDAITLTEPEAPDAYLPPECERIVFIHVPKTGGTTLRVLLSEAVGKDRVSAEGHNGLWRRTGAELSSARLFAGHYDRRCLSIIPGRRLRVVTMLREPRERLLSVYRYLRAHVPHAVAAHDLELAGAARSLAFGDFLRAALDINPAAVDNTYLRAFGSHLPYCRWEQRAEPAALQRVDDLGFPLDQLARRASGFLDQMAAVGVLEEFDRSIAAVFTGCGLAAPKSYEVKQRLADLVANNPRFEPVGEFAVSAAEERLIADLTRFDRELYSQGRRILEDAGQRRDRDQTREGGIGRDE